MVFVRETVKVDGNVLSLKNRNIRKLTDKKRKKGFRIVSYFIKYSPAARSL